MRPRQRRPPQTQRQAADDIGTLLTGRSGALMPLRGRSRRFLRLQPDFQRFPLRTQQRQLHALRLNLFSQPNML